MVGSQLSPPRVLVSDHTPDLIALIGAILSEKGYAVTASVSLPTALALVEEQLFHFILTDLYAQPNLPPFQGIEPLIAQAQPTPIAVMTAWPLSNADIKLAGVSCLLPKPFGVAELLQAVERGVQSALHKPEQERQRQVVEQFFRAWNAQDWAQVARLCTMMVRFLPQSPQATKYLDNIGLTALLTYLQGRVQALPGWHVEEVHTYPGTARLSTRYRARWVDRQGSIHKVAGGLRFAFQRDHISEVICGALNLTPVLRDSAQRARAVPEGRERITAEKPTLLPLRNALEEIARLRLCRVMDKQGVSWPVEKLINWLEWQAPDQLRISVALVQTDTDSDGAIYELDEDQHILSDSPLYRIQRYLKPLYYHLDHPHSQK